MRPRRLAFFVLIAALGAPACGSCGKGASGEGAEAGVNADLPGAGPSSKTAASAGSPSTGVGSASWTGTYKSVPHGFYMPTDAPNARDWKGLTFQGENVSQGIGEGTIQATNDTAGRVTGSLDGPLGPATLDGLLKDGTFSARVGRKNPSDGAFTGTADGKATADKIEGTMNLAASEANIIRSATFTLTRAR